MVFSSLSFLFYFLPATVAAYFVVPKRLRNMVLLVASLVFYTWGGGVFVVILLVSIFVDFFFGRLVQVGVDGNVRWRVRLGVVGSVVVNIGLLAYFKYANFFVAQINAASETMGWGEIAWTSVVLPIGISFFTFQSMSYTIDVARGAARHLSNPLDFALYVALFPQLVAGPIVRFHEIADQMVARSIGLEALSNGALRFVHGLVKKVIVADAVGQVADAMFALPAERLSTVAVWLGVAAYTLQIYFDFSGYSDMAIGLGRIFGFVFPENFNRPYSAVSITDFWRRWHITLSNWFRDYVYIPLGGSRSSRTRLYLNLGLVFLLTGTWHGANWTFIVWGIYHGSLLIVERLFGWRGLEDRPSWEPVRRTVTLVLVMFGWVLFRAESIGEAVRLWGSMVVWKSGELPTELWDALTVRNVLILVVASAVILLPRSFNGWRTVLEGAGWGHGLVRVAVVGGLLPYALILVASGSFSPFLYFQF